MAVIAPNGLYKIQNTPKFFPIRLLTPRQAHSAAPGLYSRVHGDHERVQDGPQWIHGPNKGAQVNKGPLRPVVFRRCSD